MSDIDAYQAGYEAALDDLAATFEADAQWLGRVRSISIGGLVDVYRGLATSVRSFGAGVHSPAWKATADRNLANIEQRNARKVAP